EIISLGKVVWDRDAFHTERHIWPLGYQVKRQYRSMTNPNTTTTYTGTILEKDDHPWFLLEAEDNPGHVLEAGSPTGVWTTCVKAANSHRPDPHSGAASGPDYFGLNNPTVAMMVQSLPNVEKCRNY
ncbi:F/Y-rich N-terminus-domain-containing protein, partial [Dimargaris cristalligena]